MVQAADAGTALDIAVRHNIRFYSKYHGSEVVERTVRIASKDQIERRRKHLGGKIHYEDSSGILRTIPKE